MKIKHLHEIKLTTSVTAVLLMIATFAIGVYAASIVIEPPQPTGDVFIEGEWKQASVRGYNNERFVDSTNPKNDFSLQSTEDETVFIGHARNATFACIAVDDYLMWSYQVDVGSYTAIVNILPGCLVVNEIFVSSLNTVERYVSISVYTPDGKVPVWFKYWDIGDLQKEWSGSTAFSMYHGGYMDLEGKRFYIKSIDGPLFLAEMQLMVGESTVTRPIQGIVISCDEEGLMAMVTDSKGYNWILEFNHEILVMRAVFQSETAALAGKYVSIERTYMIEGETYISAPIEGVFEEGDQWKIISKKVIRQDGTIEPNPPLATDHVEMSDVKGSAFICHDIDMGLPANIDLVGFTVKAYDDPGKYWIFADVVYGGTVSTSGYGKYNSIDDTIEFKFYVPDGSETKLYQYTFEKI